MKKRIIISFLFIFSVLAIGFFIAVFYIMNSTSSLGNVIKLHEVEQLRRSFLIELQKIQSDLHTIRTPYERNIDHIVNTGMNLQRIVSQCSSCHHSPVLAKEIKAVQRYVEELETALSYYITASANSDRINTLQKDALLIGDELNSKVQGMSHIATVHLSQLTTSSLTKVKNARNILLITIISTFIIAFVIAVRLTRFVTRPIKTLVEGTRRITSGEYGYEVPYKDETEFGELASHFNVMSTTLRNVYDRIQMEMKRSMEMGEALRKSEERYELAAAAANDGLWDWNITNNEIYYSPRWKSLIGYREQEISDKPEEWFSRIHPDDLKKTEIEIKGLLKGITTQYRNEHRILHKDGSYRWVLCRALSVKDESDNVCRIVGSLTDITERKLAEEQLIHDALHDALTGLPNRVLFLDRLRHAARRAMRQKDYQYSVLFIDMDRFKFINDSLGHAIGDQLLIEVGKRLEECLRPGETIARLGGDEFVVLLEEIKGIDDVSNIIERIQNKLSLPFNLSGNEVFTSASIGVAVSTMTDKESPEHLLQDADLAMYHAKLKGGNCYEVFDKRMHEGVVERLQMENELRRSVEKKDFTLHYQPIVSLEEERIIGFEALVRWKHPDKGLILPMAFIPIAEETGLITELTQWVLYNACRQIRLWQKQYPLSPPLSVSVNISSKLFTSQLINLIKEVIEKTGIAPDTLILEITENMIIENPKSATDLLAKLKDLNVQLHIDDFGTGYSSLSYLYQFPFDGLKIDRSFIGDGKISKENLEIVRAILALAQNLRLKVIAEGVETSDQFKELKMMDCVNMQGFLLSKPMDSGEIEKILKDPPIRSLIKGETS
jgi:diguanylate cyclase (GGDEF)-like protein/PAS domain S-box-containing protein